MGLTQAVSGSIGGSLADQWKYFYTVPAGLRGTAAVFAAVPQGANNGTQARPIEGDNVWEYRRRVQWILKKEADERREALKRI